MAFLWELFVCLFDSFLLAYLLYKKIGLDRSRRVRLVAFFVISTGLLTLLTLINMPTIHKMALMLLIYILAARWTFDCRNKNWFKAVLWPGWYLIIVTVADNVTFSIAQVISGHGVEQLLVFGPARIQFTFIYLILIASMVWVLIHLGEDLPGFPWTVSLTLFFLMGIGIYSAQSLLDISLVLQSNPVTTAQAKSLSLLGYCILLMLFALLVTFEYLGMVCRKNNELVQQRQLAQIEKQQYELLASAAESLSEWKHDYQGQLRLIATLIEQENYAELKQFSEKLDLTLPAPSCLLLSGNRIIDAVVSLRMIDAKRHHIRFNTQLFLPDRIPLSDIAFASLIGNLLDNAMEACNKIASDDLEIYFEIKPWKQMMYLFCSNSSDGIYKRNKSGQLQSTKSKEGHGIGIRRIDEIVETAGGTCRFTPEEQRFSVSIMIPLEEYKHEHCSD